ncbi:MAG: flagellar basal body rod C-terminal domain-containing protein, partial [Myxococcota bacterium]|nr:flagellar basal body rod C-terminal domain-containing protein [Myxococcota bacterium]
HSAVQGTTARTLDTAEDAATGNQRITLAAGALAVDVTDQISSGTLAAQVEIRDSVVPGLLADLDQLAFDMVSAINGVHEAGYDLDGNTGLQLFEGASVVSGAAAAMKLSTDVDGEPSALAAATDPTAVPGDGSNAIALGDLAETLAAGGGGHTFTQEAAAWIGQLGIDAAAVEANYAIQSAVTLSVESTWLQRSAVSLEEEAVNLIQYQDAYDAMAKVLQVTQQMLDTLMEI